MRIQTYDDAPMALAGDDVVIRVEASTVSDTDCRIRDGQYKWKFGTKPPFPMVPGIDCVGIITSVGHLAIKSGLDLGDRVAALSMNGCTAKYVTLKIDEVIKVPDGVVPAEAVAVVRTYTAAFQSLMTNVQGFNRYSRKPLSGDRVLIVGPCGVFERALVEIALYLGAKRVYFSCISTNQQSHDMYIRMLGAKPLAADPEDWAEELEGKIDVVVDSACIDRFEHSYAALAENGILVTTGMIALDKTDDWLSTIERGWVNAYVAMNPKCNAYEGVIENYFTNRRQFMKDLIFLFNALERGKIKPKIATKIPMMKVAAAQERLDLSPESLERRGVIVVEPWLLPPKDE
jgi:NADPH:quinone reductase-like Zn-dependent oxidoreductase